jgi:acyl-CoA synthetase (AMP-forming)/AMP-acid ligase II/acyl carrier protein
MPPAAFVRRPVRWLRTISRYHATITGGPDSAYQLCVDQSTPEERAELDLRSWRLAGNGAEPVSIATLDAFVETFGPCGFDRRAWFPTYGLAECTLMATGSESGTGASTLTVQAQALREGRVVLGNDQVIVGSGREILHRRVEIVDPATCERVEAGSIGEIWIAGPDVARGYWGRPEEQERVFGATLADTAEGPFLRSGDLGFMYEEELFVTGRLKDVIIVGGRNHYPQDVEATVVSVHESLVKGACATFSVQRNGRELVVVVAEMQPGRARPGVDVEEVARLARSAVASEHGIAVAEVALVDRKSVPKTSSGKLQRGACRSAFERGELTRAQSYTADGDVIAHRTVAERRRALRQLLVEQVESVLRVSSGSVDTTVPFQDLGLDSLMAAELRDRLELALGERLSATMFFAHPTTDLLVERLLERMEPAAPAVDEPAPTGQPAGHGDDLSELDEDQLAARLAEELGALGRVAQR